MDTEKTVNTNQSAVTDDTSKTSVDDLEAKVAALEAEKNKLIEEGSNWKVAALKYKKGSRDEDDDNVTDDERMRRIAAETLADSRLAEIAREQQAIITKALKENKELKLAQMNRNSTVVPTSVGSHTEGKVVPDTLVTAEQIKAFQARGWTDKDIERYKKNLQKYR